MARGERLPHALVKTGQIVEQQRRIEFHLDMTRRAQTAVIGQAEFLRQADIEFEGHCSLFLQLLRGICHLSFVIGHWLLVD